MVVAGAVGRLDAGPWVMAKQFISAPVSSM
jgi:hypothetical protein